MNFSKVEIFKKVLVLMVMSVLALGLGGCPNGSDSGDVPYVPGQTEQKSYEPNQIGGAAAVAGLMESAAPAPATKNISAEVDALTAAINTLVDVVLPTIGASDIPSIQDILDAIYFDGVTESAFELYVAIMAEISDFVSGTYEGGEPALKMNLEAMAADPTIDWQGFPYVSDGLELSKMILEIDKDIDPEASTIDNVNVVLGRAELVRQFASNIQADQVKWARDFLIDGDNPILNKQDNPVAYNIALNVLNATGAGLELSHEQAQLFSENLADCVDALTDPAGPRYGDFARSFKKLVKDIVVGGQLEMVKIVLYALTGNAEVLEIAFTRA